MNAMDGMTLSRGLDSERIRFDDPTAKRSADVLANAPKRGQNDETQAPVGKEAPDTEDLKNAVSLLNEYSQDNNRALKFDLDDSTGRVVIQVTNKDSGEIVRQIPPERALKVVAALQEVNGLLVDEER